MADYILSQRFEIDDAATAAANAIAAGMDKAADAADRLEVSTTKVTRSSSALLNAGDPVTKSVTQLNAAMRNLAQTQEAAAADMAKGGEQAEAFGRAVAGAQAKVEAARLKLADARAETIQGASATKAATDAMTIASAATDRHAAANRAATNVLRDFAIQGNDVVSSLISGQRPMTVLIQQGSQVAQSMQAAGYGLDALRGAASKAFAFLTTGPALIGELVAGLALLAYNSNNAATRMADLQNTLRATHDNYVALAAAADLAAKQVAASTSTSLSDARKAADVIAGAKYFGGTAADIVNLTKQSADLARIWGTDVATAAGKLRDAINDPAKAAAEFATQGLPAFNAELVRSVDRLQASGHGGEALQLVLSALGRSSAGAAENVPPLNKALHDLGEAMKAPSGKSIFDSVGDFVAADLTTFIQQITDLITVSKSISSWVASRQSTPAPTAAPYVNAAINPDATGRAPLLGPPIAGMTERATGIFQVLPSTGRELGYDVTKQDQNILAGLTYLNQQTQTRGLDGALAQYGGYGKNIGGAAGYIGKVKNADIGALPSDVAGQIMYWGQVLGLPDDLLNVGLRLAVVESGGRQYAAPSAPKPAAPFGLAPRSANDLAASANSNEIAVSGMRNDSRAADDALAGLTSGTRAMQAQELADKLSAVHAQMTRLTADGRQGSTEYAALVEQQNKVEAAQRTLLSPQQQYIKGQQDQAAAAQSVFAGQQKVLEVNLQLDKIERDQGGSFSPAQRAQAIAAALDVQSAALKQNIAQQELGVQANDNIAAAYGKGYAAVVQTTAAQNAYKEALALFPQGSQQFAAAQAALTQEYLRVAQAAEQAKIAQATRANGDQLAEIQEEIRLVGSSVEVRTRELAVLKARQELERSGVAISDEARDAYLRSVAAVTDGQAQLSRMNEAMSGLENIGTQAFDRIGTAITQAFSTGSIKALDFGGIVKGVLSEIAQYVLKMAIVNPLMNTLFGSNKSTISDVGGVLGGLLGNTRSVATDSANAGSSLVALAGKATGLGDGSAFDKDIQNIDAPAAGGGSSMLSFGTIGSVASLTKSAYGLISNSGATLGATIGNYAAQTAISVFGNGMAATNIANAALGAGVYGPATPAAVAAASTASGLGFSAETAAAITSATSTVVAALPYIGAAISVVTNIAQGNWRGAALVAAGAIVGTLILPGIGTAIGAAVGGLVDAFLPNHPKNPYESLDVRVQSGRIVAGAQVDQLQSSDSNAIGVNSYGAQFAKFLDAVGVRITNQDMSIGNIGMGIKGLNQVDSVEKLFAQLTFSDSSRDGSNFSVAKGALDGMRFASSDALVKELQKIAGFSDSMSTLGVKLESVGVDLQGIRIASVAQDGGDLRTALQHDLPGQSFANVDALSAEIDKVNQFVNGTIPGLLNPVIRTTSQLQQQIADTNQQYGAAIGQANRYGLNTQPLFDAQERADNLLIAPARKQLDQADEAVTQRGIVARGGSAYDKIQQQFGAFQAQADQQRVALTKSLTDVYGDSVLSTKYFFDQMGNLNNTLMDEATTLVRNWAKQQTTAGLQISQTVSGIKARGLTLAGDNKGAELLNFDAKAALERDSYQNQLLDFYGASYAATAEYQDRVTQLEQVQQGERLAIITKYGAQASQAQEQASQTVRGTVASLVDYARGLGTSSLSPLSSTDQLALARSQFQAVAGAAGAGDYNSIQKLQSYSDTFLNASRAVNGSGAAYAADYGQALNTLDSVGNAAADTLTASYMASIAQSQTDQLVDELKKLRSEVAALRTQQQQSSAAPARIAA